MASSDTDRTRELFDKFPRAILVHDHGHLLYANEATLKLLGYASFADLAAASPEYNHIAPEYRALVKERIASRDRGEPVPDQYESQLVRNTGERIWVCTVRIPIQWDSRAASLVSFLDLTESKHIQQELRESQALLRAVFDTIPVWLWVKDLEGKYLMFNRKMAEDLRISLDRIGQLHAADLPWMQSHLETIAAQDKQILDGASSAHAPDQVGTFADGTTHVMNIFRYPLRDGDGKLTGSVGFGFDITRRKQVEADLRRNEERYRALVEGSVQGIAIFSLRDYRALFANEAVLKLTGEASVDDYLRLVTLFNRICEPFVAELRRSIERLANGEIETLRNELQARRKDGSVYWKEFVARRVEWEAESAVQITMMDITARKQAEEALKDHQAVLLKENEVLKQDIDRRRERKQDGIVAESPAMQRVLREAEAAAKSRLPILIEGETGVGKEVVAEFIHRHSDRSSHVMSVVNCGALTEALMDAELFGYERGAFTGATDARAGLIEIADHGTLFLDEIGDLPASGQVRLLRFLERGVVRRVGSTREKHVDVRILAATHKTLKAQMEAGTFREDLYHRLLVIRIEVPPLRNRIEDIIPLALSLMEAACQEAHLAPRTLGREARLAMTAYAWPGNVRELSHTVQRAVFASQLDGTTELRPHHLDLPLSAGSNIWGVPIKQYLRTVEQKHVREVLRRVNGNRRLAAETLGISERHLYRLLQ
jgi:PAS domain S-box-containing protein